MIIFGIQRHWLLGHASFGEWAATENPRTQSFWQLGGDNLSKTTQVWASGLTWEVLEFKAICFAGLAIQVLAMWGAAKIP